MISNEKIIRFCEKTKLLSRKPNNNSLLEAIKMDIDFGIFLNESMKQGMNFDSCQDFLSCFHSFANGLNGPS